MVPIADLTRVSLRVGLLSFGGPAAQIALMHREFVEARKWLSEKDYLNALSFCMLLPGPEAMQLATYVGWKLRGVPGGLIAGGLFVIPGAIIIAALAAIYAWFGQVPFVAALFLGVQATVVVIVIEALLRVAKKALNGWDHWVIAALAFLGISVFQLPYPLIVIAAGLWGLAAARGEVTEAPPRAKVNTLATVSIWLAIWGAPLALLWALDATLLVEIGVFFSKLAVVTFGGAYAVLAYMTQAVVGDFGWLTLPEMMYGLGLAETTPGPLILVTEFVGFLAGYREGGIGLALLAALVTIWMTFAPCFLWIFAGAPYIDWIAARPRLSGALRAITAAVVGVILNLSIWFAVHVFFASVGATSLGPATLLTPDPTSLDPVAVTLALLAGYLILRRHWGLPSVLGLAALLGAGLGAIGLA
ncbi:MAG: chromate efflux transporter [Rhodobacteraceae bacterium]|nr:chromate efflux transporter [Paracoccaceae bacterium]